MGRLGVLVAQQVHERPALGDVLFPHPIQDPHVHHKGPHRENQVVHVRNPRERHRRPPLHHPVEHSNHSQVDNGCPNREPKVVQRRRGREHKLAGVAHHACPVACPDSSHIKVGHCCICVVVCPM